MKSVEQLNDKTQFSKSLENAGGKKALPIQHRLIFSANTSK